MSSGLYSHTTRATGTVLTAAIYNADHQNHITNQNPSATGGYSDNLTQHQLNSDPGGLGAEVLGTSVAAELEQLRFCIKRITGKTQWYVAPDTDLASVGGTIQHLVVDKSVSFRSDLTPAQITANQNDYAPAGHADAFMFRLSADASRNITGLQGGTDGRIVVLTNVGTQNITLTDDDVLSTAANRFRLESTLTIRPDQAISLIYDAVLSRWRTFNTATFDTYPFTNISASIATINNYIEMPEVSAPANPAANSLRLYAKDVTGVTRLVYRDSAGAETIVATPVVQVPRTANASYTANTNLTPSIPSDDTIPQNTEGTEILTATITPQSASSKVKVSFTCFFGAAGGTSASAEAAAALFKDSGANAIHASYNFHSAGAGLNIVQTLSLVYIDSPATTSAVTYKIRVGAGATIRLNGTTTGRVFGGAAAANLVVEEILPQT
jgi:hypothetical protein